METLDKHIATYTAFHNKNGSFVGGGELTDLLGREVGHLVAMSSDFVETSCSFLCKVVAPFSDALKNTKNRLDFIVGTLKSFDPKKVSEAQMGKYYAAYESAMKSHSPAFVGGDCDCAENVISYSNNSAYLVFQGGVEVEKSSALILVGAQTLIDLIVKSMQNKSAQALSAETKELARTYVDALKQLKTAVNDVNADMSKRNANLKKEFDSYAKLTPAELIKRIENSTRNAANKADFIRSIKLLGPTTFYADKLKDALSKLGIAVKDFKEANTNSKFNSLLDKAMLAIKPSDANYTKKINALELVKKLHYENIVIEGSADVFEPELEPEVEVDDYVSYFGGGGESIFGGDILALDKKVNAMNTVGDFATTPREIAFREENAKVLEQLVRSANDASSEMYNEKDYSSDMEIVGFLSRLSDLKIANVDNETFSNMFFKDPSAFGLGYSRDAYLNHLDDVIKSGKSVEGKIGPKFTAFIKELVNYKTFLLSSVDKAAELVKHHGFGAKFFGGLQSQWSYNFNDVIDSFTRGIMVSRMRLGLDHSIKELEKYTGEQTKMNSKILGREINTIVSTCNDIMTNMADGSLDNSPYAGCKVPPALSKAVLTDNVDGFVQLQRAVQALNERCSLYQLELVKNPSKVREIADLLKKVAIDINSIGDEHFKHLTEFLEYFHVESIAKPDNKLEDIKFITSYSPDEIPLNYAFTDPDHNIRLYKNNEYLKHNKNSSFPLTIQDTLSSHVPTMIFATKTGTRIKKNDITGESINAYGGKRIFPAKDCVNYTNQLESIIIDNLDTPVANSGVVWAAAAGGGVAKIANEYQILGTITSPSYIPRVVKFIPPNDMIAMYNEAKEHLVSGVRQITSLKNLFSVFQSIDKAYYTETSKVKFSMKIGEIYEAIINYIIKTTLYPILYSSRDNNVTKYYCSHIALRKFGYEIVCPLDTTSTNVKLSMFSALESLSLREYMEGVDYGNQSTPKWNATSKPFPKTSELISYVGKDKTLSNQFITNNKTYSNMFVECDSLCVMSLKSVVAKIFSVLSLFNVINLKDLTGNLEFNKIRAIMGGVDISHTMTPSVKSENIEVYLRLYLIMLFYKGLFFEESIGAGLQHIIAGARRMAVLPGGNPKFDPLMKFIFLRKFTDNMSDMSTSINSMNIYDFGIFLDICNNLVTEYKGSSMKHIQNIISDLVDEINRRYGIVSTDQIKSLMKKEHDRSYPNLRSLTSTGFTTPGSALHADRVPPTLLDGEGGDFRDTKVPSDNVQFGETSVGRILNIINPVKDDFNTEEILSVVYNFRKKLDNMMGPMNDALIARNERTSPLASQNNIGHKCVVLGKQLSNYSDNKGKLEFIKKAFDNIGVLLTSNVNTDEILYREFVVSPCALMNKLYNRLIAMTNLYGKQTYNNVLNLNTHLYDLDSINTDLVTVVGGATMPKLDFRVLAETCKGCMEQISYFHNKLKTGLTNTDDILDKTIDLLINQHNYVWDPKGPLAEDSLDYNSIVFVPINDYSEFPNVVYNDGTENLVGTNSWTAYRGKGIYDDNPTIEDPRLKNTKNRADGTPGLQHPVLEMSILTERFSPKNPYQLFEYLLIVAYKLFYQQTGTIYQPLFSEFVDRLGDFVDFNSVVTNDTLTELGGVHKFQPSMPISDKIAIVYRTLYRAQRTGSTSVQSDITLLPKECISLMQKFIPLFLMLLSYIIRQSTIHRHILSINRYAGGPGLDATDSAQYTMGTAYTVPGAPYYELFPRPPAAGALAAEYIDYYNKLISTDLGIGMRLYSGAVMKYITNTKVLDNKISLLSLVKTTKKLDKEFTKALAKAQNSMDIKNLTGRPVDYKFNSLLLNKYQDTGRLIFDAINNPEEYDFISLADTGDLANTKKEITKYYAEGVKKNIFDIKPTLSDQGVRIQDSLNDVFNSTLMNNISHALQKYYDDLIKTPKYFNVANQTPEQNMDHILNNTPPIQYDRFPNLAAEFGITFAGNTSVGIPSRNVGNNAYLECFDDASFQAQTAALDALAISGALNVAKVEGARANVAIPYPGGVNNFNNGLGATERTLFVDEACTKRVSGEEGLHGRKIYTKVKIDAPHTGYIGYWPADVNNLTWQNRYLDASTTEYRTNADIAHSVCFGHNAIDTLGANTAAFLIKFIDNINTSYTNIDMSAPNTLNDCCGLFTDAILMYNKFIKLGNKESFEEYLPNFIVERLDLILGKDSDSFTSIAFSLLSTLQLPTRIHNIDALGVIAVTPIPTNATYNEFIGISYNNNVYNNEDNVQNISELPGISKLGDLNLYLQSDIYNEFNYTDCNPYHDILSCAAYCNEDIFHDVNPLNTYSRIFNSMVGLTDKTGTNIGAARVGSEIKSIDNVDLSHNRSMNNLSRLNSTGNNKSYDLDAINGRHSYLPLVYELFLKHILVFDNSTTFSQRYNNFKTAMLNGFLKSYTPYNDINSFKQKNKNNQSYKYIPIATIGTTGAGAGGGLMVIGPGNITGLHKLVYLNTQYDLSKMLSVANYGQNGLIHGGCMSQDIINYYVPTSMSNVFKDTDDVFVNGGGFVPDVRYTLESQCINKGVYTLPILINPESDLAIKHRILNFVFTIAHRGGHNNLASIVTNINTLNWPRPFNITEYISKILSLNTSSFIVAVKILHKLIIYGVFMHRFCHAVGGPPRAVRGILTEKFQLDPNSSPCKLGFINRSLINVVGVAISILNNPSLKKPPTINDATVAQIMATMKATKSYPQQNIPVICDETNFATETNQYFKHIVDNFRPVLPEIIAALGNNFGIAAPPAFVISGVNPLKTAAKTALDLHDGGNGIVVGTPRINARLMAIPAAPGGAYGGPDIPIAEAAIASGLALLKNALANLQIIPARAGIRNAAGSYDIYIDVVVADNAGNAVTPIYFGCEIPTSREAELMQDTKTKRIRTLIKNYTTQLRANKADEALKQFAVNQAQQQITAGGGQATLQGHVVAGVAAAATPAEQARGVRAQAVLTNYTNAFNNLTTNQELTVQINEVLRVLNAFLADGVKIHMNDPGAREGLLITPAEDQHNILYDTWNNLDEHVAAGATATSIFNIFDVEGGDTLLQFMQADGNSAVILQADDPLNIGLPRTVSANPSASLPGAGVGNLRNTVLNLRNNAGGVDPSYVELGDSAKYTGGTYAIIKLLIFITSLAQCPFPDPPGAGVRAVNFANPTAFDNETVDVHAARLFASLRWAYTAYETFVRTGSVFTEVFNNSSEKLTTFQLRRTAINLLRNLKYGYNTNDMLIETSNLCSRLDSEFILPILNRNTFDSTLDAMAYMSIVTSPKFLNKFLIAKALSSTFNNESLLSLVNYSLVGASYSNNSAIYVNETITAGEILATTLYNPANLVLFYNGINTELNKLYKTLLKSLESYYECTKTLYYSPTEVKYSATLSGTKSNKYNEPGNFITSKQTRTAGDNAPGDATFAADQLTKLGRPAAVGAVDERVLRITTNRTPAFVNENFEDENCIMSELALPGISIEDMRNRSKNAVILAMSLYKSMSAVYFAIGDDVKYLEQDKDLAGLRNFMNKGEETHPLTYAIELIPNVINVIKSTAGVFSECNVLKTIDTEAINTQQSLGLKCRNMKDLNKLFLGDKSNIYSLIKIFLMSDNMKPLTAKDFPWTADIIKSLSSAGVVDSTLDDKNVSSYIQTVAKLTKYLYEIEFKSNFGNMFPVFNNLDNPKFNITAAPAAANPLTTAVRDCRVNVSGKDVGFSSLATLLPGVFSYRANTLTSFPYADMIALTFDRSNTGRSNKSLGFCESNMLDAIELSTLIDLGSNSESLKKIMDIKTITGVPLGVRRLADIHNQLGRLIGENILDIGIFPINIHSMAKEIPMAEMINNVYTYDIIMKWLLNYETDPLHVGYFSFAGAVPAVNGGTTKLSRAIDAASLPGAVVPPVDGFNPPLQPDNHAGAITTIGRPTKTNLYKSQLYNYCINPFKSYIYPIGIKNLYIVDSNWVVYHPTLSGLSKQNSISTKSRLPNIIGLIPPIGMGGLPDGALAKKDPIADDYYIIKQTVANFQYNNASKLTQDLMHIGYTNLNGNYVLDGLIVPRTMRNMTPIQYNLAAIAKADSALNDGVNIITNQTLNIDLGVHLSDIDGKIGITSIRKSKLVKALMGDYPVMTSLNNLTNKTISGLAVPRPPMVPGNLLSTSDVYVDSTSYFGKQRVGDMKTYQMDLCHGVDAECQQPVLGLNIFADVLMNIYTAKLYDEIKTQRNRSSQVLIGDAAIFDLQNN